MVDGTDLQLLLTVQSSGATLEPDMTPDGEWVVLSSPYDLIHGEPDGIFTLNEALGKFRDLSG